jgi:hypothetical protein
MNVFPLPGLGRAVTAVPAPGAGIGYWAGSSSAAVDEDGSFVVAYRVREGAGPEGGAATVVARSDDGEHLTTVATLDKSRFGAMSMERPALARTGSRRWRLYVCSATPNSKHWWIDLLEADDPAGFADADPRTVFAGDEYIGVKDPLVQRVDGGWQAWICCHPLDKPGEEDRMTTAYATSADGLDWEWHGTVLSPRPNMWDARAARVTAVLSDGRASYDGRATKEENWFERTGLARHRGQGRLEPAGDEAVADVRYLDVVSLSDGDFRIYYEARLPDESHELRTELIEPR